MVGFYLRPRFLHVIFLWDNFLFLNNVSIYILPKLIRGRIKKLMWVRSDVSLGSAGVSFHGRAFVSQSSYRLRLVGWHKWFFGWNGFTFGGNISVIPRENYLQRCKIFDEYRWLRDKRVMAYPPAFYSRSVSKILYWFRCWLSQSDRIHSASHQNLSRLPYFTCV